MTDMTICINYVLLYIYLLSSLLLLVSVICLFHSMVLDYFSAMLVVLTLLLLVHCVVQFIGNVLPY